MRGPASPADAATGLLLGSARSLPVLGTSQVLGGVGVAAGFAVGGILAEQVSGSTALSGLTQTASVLGGALLAVPLAGLAERRGRAVALGTGYGLAFVGAVATITAALLDSFALLLAAFALFGSATAAGLQARYAATDGVDPRIRARVLSLVVWATTIGSVAGPNLAEPAAVIGGWFGLPPLLGPYVVSAAGFGLAMLVVGLGHRRFAPAGSPGPAVPGVPPGGTAATPETTAPVATAPDITAAAPIPLTPVRAVLTIPAAAAGVVAAAGAHAVMVGVMVMTPVHLEHTGDTLTLVGIVISAHIAGMYALSPIVGWAVDRFGPTPVISTGIAILAAAVGIGMSGLTPHGLTAIPLTLLGLGWSCCMVAGSTMLTSAVPAAVRTRVQGIGDLVLGLSGAAAGVFSGPILAAAGYRWLNAFALIALVPLLVAVVRAWGWRPVSA